MDVVNRFDLQEIRFFSHRTGFGFCLNGHIFSLGEWFLFYDKGCLRATQ
jgi:hypothetical protein